MGRILALMAVPLNARPETTASPTAPREMADRASHPPATPSAKTPTTIAVRNATPTGAAELGAAAIASSTSPATMTAMATPWRQASRMCSTSHAITAVTAMLLATADCTRNSGRVRNASSERAHPSPSRPRPAT